MIRYFLIFIMLFNFNIFSNDEASTSNTLVKLLSPGQDEDSIIDFTILPTRQIAFITKTSDGEQNYFINITNKLSNAHTQWTPQKLTRTYTRYLDFLTPYNDENFLIVSDKQIQIHDSSSGKLIKGFENAELQTRHGTNLAVVLGDELLATVEKCGKKIQICNFNKKLRTLDNLSDFVSSLKALPAGLLASGSYDSNIKIWNPHTGECCRTLTGLNHTVYSMAVLSNGLLASATKQGDIKFWKAENGELVKTLKTDNFKHLAFFADGAPVLASETEINFNNTRTKIAKSDEFMASIETISALGNILVVLFYNKTIKVFERE